MYSKYFGIDIDIPEQTMLSGGEEVHIIPHAVLEDILYNSEAAISKNVIIHYTPITTNEARHYACLCAISDSLGRRTESVGESLDSTLDTDIARNYPVLMAYKRAFDDAAIKYLGLNGKVYSDQQIARSDGETKSSGITAPDFAQDDFGAEDAGTLPDETSEAEADNWPPDDEFGSAFDSQPDADDYAAQENENDNHKPTSNTPAKRRRFGRNAGSTTPNAMPQTVKDKPRGKPVRGQIAARSAQSGEFGENNGGDEFDELLECSRLKEPCSIREAYAKDPNIIHWCATQMRVYSQVDEENKARCQRYIELMEGDTQ